MQFTQTIDNHNWKDVLEQLRGIRRSLRRGDNLALALVETDSFLAGSPDPKCKQRLEDIKENYGRMTDVMLHGYVDSQRPSLYAHLAKALYRLLLDMELGFRLRWEPLLMRYGHDFATVDIPALRERAEGFVSEVALLSLGATGGERAREVYKAHGAYSQHVFQALFLSPQWQPGYADNMADLLVSPTIDANDAALLVSAITLGCLLVFDPEKACCLMGVFQRSTDKQVKQRALVGWALAIDCEDQGMFAEVSGRCGQLLADEEVRKSLQELQTQVLYCENATNDSETIRKDIMPNIIKNQNLEFTRNGIREKEDDPLEDILHPDAADKRMEELEKNIQRVMDMQKRGVDIYFGGFSQMKRFPFFYTLSNWFTPFYVQHPQLSQVSKELLGSNFLQVLLNSGPFCDSDKYSFVLGLSTVYERLPANIREVMDQGEAFAMKLERKEMQSDTYVRRMYLQDLYRFFQLNDLRNCFPKVFDQKAEHLFLENEAYVGRMAVECRSVQRFLLSQKNWGALSRLHKLYGDPESRDDMMMRALIASHDGDYELSKAIYEKLHGQDATDEAATKGLAQACFRVSDYAGASKAYRLLADAHPDRLSYSLNLAISLVNADEAAEGLQILYRLDYEHPAEINVKRALAWGLLWLGRLADAEKTYSAILDSGAKTPVDSLNAGYCAWFSGDYQSAAKRFRAYLAGVGGEEKMGILMLEKQFACDKAVLDKYKIEATECKIMADLGSRG